MREQDQSRDSIRATISGDVSGQVAVGKNIRQAQSINAASQGISEAELAQLRQLFADLKAEVADQAPPEKRDAALERVDELEEAVNAEKPDLTTIAYVRSWFARNIPKLAGAVLSVVVHPIVGKIVEAGGELAADEFRRRFGPHPQEGGS